MIKYCDIKAAKPRSVKKMVRRRRSTAQTGYSKCFLFFLSAALRNPLDRCVFPTVKVLVEFQ